MSDPNSPQDPGQPYQQPQYGSPQQGYPAPYGQGYPATAEDPGKTLGIIGLVLSFFTALIGMIVSIVALRKSKKAGFKNTPALIGIIIGALGTVLAIIAIIVSVVVAGAAISQFQEVCQQLGPGTHEIGGTTYTCPG